MIKISIFRQFLYLNTSLEINKTVNSPLNFLSIRRIRFKSLSFFMSVPFTSLTIQDIADSIGVKLSNQELVSSIDRDCDQFIRKIVTQANAFCTSTRSYKLSPIHLDMVLESLGLPPLLGYDSVPNYMATPLSVDQADIFGVRENMCSLHSIVKEPIAPLSNNINHQLQWTLVEGTYTGKRSSSRDRSSKQRSENKSIERSVSVPNVSSIQHTDTQLNSSSALENPDKLNQSESKKCADDILSNEHQKYFISTINLLRSDTVHSLDVALYMISQEDKMQPLLPYFIQYITGKMTTDFNNVKSMKVLIRFTLSLVQNKSMNIPLYAHPFLRIIFSALLSSNVSSSDSNSSYTVCDTDVRRYAADALAVLIYRCESSFCEMREVIFNALQQALFDADTSLYAHYGAILGISSIGLIGKLLPHFRSYLRSIKFELDSSFNFQGQAVNSVLNLAKKVFFEFVAKSSDTEEKKIAENILEDIESIT